MKVVVHAYADSNVLRELREHPERFRILGYGDRKGGAVYLTPDGRALKVYRPHPNKMGTAERALHEMEMINRVSDLPGAPRGAQLLLDEDGAPVLLREAGVIPDTWTVRDFLAVQETLQALVDRRIVLNDGAQVARRVSGEAFLFDWDVASPVGAVLTEYHLLEYLSESLTRWLREIGYPDRRLRRRLEADWNRGREILAFPAADGRPAGIRRLWQQTVLRSQAALEREDACRQWLQSGQDPELEMGYLFGPADWAQKLEDLLVLEKSARRHLERARPEGPDREEAVAYWRDRLHALTRQRRRAQEWVARWRDGDEVLRALFPVAPPLEV